MNDTISYVPFNLRSFGVWKDLLYKMISTNKALRLLQLTYLDIHDIIKINIEGVGKKVSWTFLKWNSNSFSCTAVVFKCSFIAEKYEEKV